MDQFLEDAREAYGNESIRQEAKLIAEEFLPLENEALDKAGGQLSGNLQHTEPGRKWWK